MSVSEALVRHSATASAENTLRRLVVGPGLLTLGHDVPVLGEKSVNAETMKTRSHGLKFVTNIPEMPSRFASPILVSNN